MIRVEQAYDDLNSMISSGKITTQPVGFRSTNISGFNLNSKVAKAMAKELLAVDNQESELAGVFTSYSDNSNYKRPSIILDNNRYPKALVCRTSSSQRVESVELDNNSTSQISINGVKYLTSKNMNDEVEIYNWIIQNYNSINPSLLPIGQYTDNNNQVVGEVMANESSSSNVLKISNDEDKSVFFKLYDSSTAGFRVINLSLDYEVDSLINEELSSIDYGFTLYLYSDSDITKVCIISPYQNYYRIYNDSGILVNTISKNGLLNLSIKFLGAYRRLSIITELGEIYHKEYDKTHDLSNILGLRLDINQNTTYPYDLLIHKIEMYLPKTNSQAGDIIQSYNRYKINQYTSNLSDTTGLLSTYEFSMNTTGNQMVPSNTKFNQALMICSDNYLSRVLFNRLEPNLQENEVELGSYYIIPNELAKKYKVQGTNYLLSDFVNDGEDLQFNLIESSIETLMLSNSKDNYSLEIQLYSGYIENTDYRINEDNRILKRVEILGTYNGVQLSPFSTGFDYYSNYAPANTIELLSYKSYDNRQMEYGLPINVGYTDQYLPVFSYKGTRSSAINLKRPENLILVFSNNSQYEINLDSLNNINEFGDIIIDNNLCIIRLNSTFIGNALVTSGSSRNLLSSVKGIRITSFLDDSDSSSDPLLNIIFDQPVQMYDPNKTTSDDQFYDIEFDLFNTGGVSYA